MEKDAVNETVETTTETASQTVEAESQVAPDESAQTSTEEAGEAVASPSEGVNTPTDKAGNDVVDAARAEVNSEKSQNRVQELANRLKQAEAENARLKEIETAIRQGKVPNQEGGLDDLNEVQQLKYEVAIMNRWRQQQEERSLWSEAAKLYPELDDSSDQHDVTFDDLVYYTYEGAKAKDPTFTPAKAAQLVRQQRRLAESRGVAQAESTREAKESGSMGPARRTQVATAEASDIAKASESARQRLSQSGDVEDLAAVLSLRRQQL